MKMCPNSVAGLDNAGHGRSPGIPCFIPSFSALVKSNASFLRKVILSHQDNVQKLPEVPSDALGEANRPKLPCFVLGESMGGATAIYLARQLPELVDGAILLAPMCGIDPVSPTMACISPS